MSPRKLRRRNSMDHSITSTRSRSKARSLLTSEKKTLSYNENNEKEKDLSNVFLLNDSQQKHENTRSTPLFKNKMYLEKSKKCYISNKSTLTQNLELKENEDVVDNNSLVGINNITYELLEQSPIQFKDTSVSCNKMKQFKISPVQSPINFNMNTKEENIHSNSLNGTITPKCSPISVMLTPLRTTKTPKKSPVNLGSPKIPSEVPLRLSKTPRKLQLFSSSPTVSSSLNTSLRNRKNISNNIQKTTLGNISVSDSNGKSNKLRKSRTSTEKLKLMLRRSKSPNIVLRGPRSKSAIRASKIKLGNRKNGSISGHKLSSKKNVSRKTSAFSNKSVNNDKSLTSGESELELTLTNVNDLSEEYKEIISKKPIVLLERIPLLDSFSVSLKTQSNRHLMDTTLDVAKHVQKQLFKNLSSLRHSISHINHKYPMKTEESILSESFNNKKNLELNNTSFIVSSTPVSTRSSNSPFTPRLFTDERVKQNVLVEDDVKNSTYDMNETNDNQNNTMVIENEETATADETYDLLEPRTPHLKRQQRKSATVDVDNDKKEIKKVFKVRFTTPERQLEKLQSSNNVAIRKTPCVKNVSRKRSNSLSNTSINKSTPNLGFKRSISMSNVDTTPKNSNKKEKTPSSTSSKTQCNTADEGKNDIKTRSVKKKIPNFVEIHKQMFAKMESVVDNKRRLMQQHEALKTPKLLRLDKYNMKKCKSTETKNESCNKFGFRVKKADATNIILKKQQTSVQKKKREENKEFLKGVRTNRRFELLMKMRKISD